MFGLYAVFALIMTFISEVATWVGTTISDIASSIYGFFGGTKKTSTVVSSTGNEVSATKTNVISNIDDIANLTSTPIVPTHARSNNMLFNIKDYSRLRVLENKFQKYSGYIKPEDYNDLDEYCKLSDRYPILQSATSHQWCPPGCQKGIAEYRDATEKYVVPYWGKGLDLRYRDGILKFCKAAEPLINNGCSPDITQETYWQELCANPDCRDADLAWLDAEKGLEDLRSVGANTSVQNWHIQNEFCPTAKLIDTSCPPDHIAKRYAGDPYYQLCKRGENCPTVPDEWYKAAEPVRTMQKAGTNFNATIDNFCKHGADMSRCGYDFYSTDPLYKEWCTDPECRQAYLEFLDERDSFNWMVQQNVNEDGQIQEMQSRYCPAAEKLLTSCGGQTERRDLVLKDPYYQKYCKNPECTKNRLTLLRANANLYNQVSQTPDQSAIYQTMLNEVCPAFDAAIDSCGDNSLKQDAYYKQYCRDLQCTKVRYALYQTQKDFDWQVSQGLNANGQLQTLRDKLCPAMQAVMDETTCEDEDRSFILKDPYWRDYCSEPGCLPARLKLQQTQDDFNWQVSQNPDQNAMYQMAFNTLCPAFDEALANCNNDEFRNRILQDPYYKQYCKNRKCAELEFDNYKKMKDFQWSIDQGINSTGQLQELLRNVCPSMQAIMDEDSCSDENKSLVTNNLYWQKYCSNAACIPYNLAMVQAEADFQNAVSQNADEDAQWQMASKSLCPAYADVLSECTDPELIAHVEQNPYYKKYCANPKCAAERHQWYIVQKEFDWQVSQNLDYSGQLQTLKDKLCPAMQAVMSDNTCDQNTRRVIENNPYWQKYCRDPKCLPDQQAVEAAESDYNWAVAQGVTEDGLYQTAFNKLCPAYQSVLGDCAPDSDIVKHVMSHPYYHKYCEFKNCAEKQLEMVRQRNDFNWAVSQGVDQSGQYQMLINHVCPVYQAAWSTCPDSKKSEISADYIWTKYCSDFQCLGPQSQLTEALKDFNWAVSQGMNQDSQYQMAFDSLCPAFASVKKTCKDPETLAKIDNDLLFQRYCLYLDCAKKQYKLHQAEQDWNWSVSQGLNKNDQYQKMIDSVCPAMIDIHDSCDDPKALSAVEANPYWSQYCKDGVDCLRSRLEVSLAYNITNQTNLDDNAKWQLAQDKFCPAFSHMKQSCAGNPAMITQIENDPWYQNYCKNPSCAKSINDIYNAEKDLNWSLSQGLDEDGLYQSLINTVCPLIESAIAECPAKSSEIESDPYYTICSLGQPCLQNTLSMKRTINDINWVVSQGTNQDNVTQKVLGQLCPIFNSTMQTCDKNTKDWIMKNPYWTDYCQYSDCTAAVQSLRNKQNDFNWSNTTQENQYHMLINSICPAYDEVLRNTCNFKLIDELKTEPQWTQYCSKGYTCLSNQLKLLKEETDLNWRMSQGLNEDGMYQTLQTKVCPAMKSLEQSCPDAKDWNAKDKWYDPYCKYIDCTATKQEYNNLMTNYNYQYSNLDAYGRAKTVSTVCPIFDKVARTCPPDTVKQLNQGSLYDQCRADARCPVWRYQRDDAINQLWKYGNWYNLNTNNSIDYNIYCNLANQTLNMCGDYDASYTQNPDYIRWCKNSQCRDTVMNLNFQIKDKGNSMNYVNESSKQFLADYYVCPLIRALPQTCSPGMVQDYLANENQGWFDYMLNRCPIPSSTDKSQKIMLQTQDPAVCLQWDKNVEGAQIRAAPCDPTNPNQLWYKDTAYTGIVRAANAPTSWGQDRGMVYNGGTMQFELRDTGSRNNNSASKFNIKDGDVWSSQLNNQCFQIDSLGATSLVPCANATTKLTGISPTVVVKAAPTQAPDTFVSLQISTRLLNANWSGPCMKVRRGSDNTSMDIGFTLDGWLDSASLLAFTGPTDSGYVTTWYDQSGLDNHAVQTKAANQPVIVETGSLVLNSGGSPCVKFMSSAQTYMQMKSFPIHARYGDIYLSGQQTTGQGWARWFDFGTGGSTFITSTPVRGDNSQIGYFVQTGGSMYNVSGGAANDTAPRAVSFIFDNKQMAIRINGSQTGVNTGIPPFDFSTHQLDTLNYLGKSQFSTDPYYNGLMGEIICYSGNLDATERTAVETNQRGAFGTK